MEALEALVFAASVAIGASALKTTCLRKAKQLAKCEKQTRRETPESNRALASALHGL